MYVKIIARRNK